MREHAGKKDGSFKTQLCDRIQGRDMRGLMRKVARAKDRSLYENRYPRRQIEKIRSLTRRVAERGDECFGAKCAR